MELARVEMAGVAGYNPEPGTRKQEAFAINTSQLANLETLIGEVGHIQIHQTFNP